MKRGYKKMTTISWIKSRNANDESIDEVFQLIFKKT